MSKLQELIYEAKKLIPFPKVQVSRQGILIVLSLISIFIIALSIRCIPFFLYPAYIRAFDPWLQYRCALYVVTYGFDSWYSWYDHASWYPIGRDMSQSFYPGTPFAAAIIYFLLHALGFNIDIYMICYFFPAFMGALTCVAAYFLGKEILDKKTGLIAAFLLSFTPAFIERTTVGFFDNEALGMLFLVLALYFFIRSLKRSSIISAIFAGLCVGGLASTWGAYIYLMYILPLTVILLLLLKKYSSRIFTTYGITMALTIFIITRVPTHGTEALKTMDIIPALLVLGILLFYEIFLRLNTQRTLILETIKRYIPLKGKASEKIEWFFENRQRFLILVGGIMSILVIAVIVVKLDIFGDISGLGAKFISIIYPTFREQQHIIASVGEHMPTPWGIFFYNLNVLVVLFPVGLYFAFKRRYEEDLLLIIFGVTVTYFTGSMIRIIIMLAPAACLLSAYALSIIFKPLAQVITKRAPTIARRRRIRISAPLGRDSALAVFAIIGIILTASFFLGVNTTIYSPPPSMIARDSYGGAYLDWDQAFSFMRNELPANAVVASWWDYGYWITAKGGKITLADGNTRNFTQIGWIGRAFMETNETYSLEHFRRFSATHVLVFFGYNDGNIHGDEGKWIWMSRIATDETFNMVENLFQSRASQEYVTQFVANTPYEYKFYNPYVLPGASPIQEAFFNTTIYKLLYYHAPDPNTSPYQFSQYSLDYTLYHQMYNYKYPLVKGANETAQQAYPYLSSWTAGFRDLNYFKPVFISSNGLVKIYEIDYSVLDSGLNIITVDVYSNRTGFISLNNTGITTYDIKLMSSNSSVITDLNVSLPISLAPNETLNIKFTVPQSVNVGGTLIIKVHTSIPDFYAQMNVTVKKS
ncbi:MAG: STT3 domain-containing protein [Candidatus Jordarchaeum sp.]|uniref:STT3 domain-containing protein n=1 Tax=Candidatus Jordarchaeum sp. TaxID=2823881 RepID=UPI00404A1D6E